MENNVKGKRVMGMESGDSGTDVPKSCYQQNLQTLDEYLGDKNTYDIYEELTTPGNDLFETDQKTLLTFFQLLFQKICFVECNKLKPLAVAENLKKNSLTSEQANFLFAKILKYFESARIHDENLDICCRKISRLQAELNFQQNLKEKPMPSEWEELRRENKEARDKETALLIEEQKLLDHQPYIESVMSYFDKPDELAIYLNFFSNDKRLEEAISFMNAEEPYKSVLSDERNQKSWLVLAKYRVDKLSEFSESINDRLEESEDAIQITPKEQETINKDETNNELRKENVIGSYSIYYRNRIIDAAVRLTERQDTWGELELMEELDTSKSTLDRQKKFFGLKMRVIRDEANAKIREKKT